jgi:hypothetical protein
VKGLAVLVPHSHWAPSMAARAARLQDLDNIVIILMIRLLPSTPLL